MPKSKKTARTSATSTRSARARTSTNPRVVRVNALLFSDDIALVRERAREQAVSTSLYLRQIVRDALRLKIYKFFVRADEKVVIPLGEIDPLTGDYPKGPQGEYLNGQHEISDRACACVAHSQEEALNLLEASAVQGGEDPRWLRMAPHVVELPLKGPAFIMWVQH